MKAIFVKAGTFLAFLLISQLACKPAEVAISPSLTAEPMPVKGRNGFLIGQVIRYGEYTTDKVRRGWTGSYEFPFILRFRGAREKLSYTQFGPGGIRAEVSCISRFRSTDLPLLEGFFSLPLDIRNTFAGNIALRNGASSWDFVLYNPNGDFLRDRASAGYVQNSAHRIDIQAIRGLKDQPEWMQKLTVFGHEFYLDDRVVAAVSTLDRGTVWIDPSLNEETRTVIAAVATGLLLRTDVEEAP